MHRNGEPLPRLEPSEDRDSPARERLRQRLNETGQRLRRYEGLGQNDVKLHAKAECFVFQTCSAMFRLVFHKQLPQVTWSGLDQIAVQAVFAIENHIVPANGTDMYQQTRINPLVLRVPEA
jgi:hypothetical protein